MTHGMGKSIDHNPSAEEMAAAAVQLFGSARFVGPTHRHPLSDDVHAGVYPTVPAELERLVAAEDELAELLTKLTAPEDNYGDLLKRITQDLVDGKGLPKTFAATTSRVIAKTQERETARYAVHQLQLNLQDRWQKAAAEHVDEMLAGLRGQLDDLLSETRAAVANLGRLDPSDPEAVAVGSPEQLSAISVLKVLRPRYRRLRGLQAQLVESVLATPWKHGPRDGNHWAWKSVWKSRVHEFRDGALPTAGPNVLWYRELLSRSDIWLPNMDDLRDAWWQTGQAIAAQLKDDERNAKR